jgi:hypothetical protein
MISWNILRVYHPLFAHVKQAHVSKSINIPVFYNKKRAKAMKL